MRRALKARIEWTPEYTRVGLPPVTETIDPSIFVGDPPDAEKWSLVCRYDLPPARQGSPSAAMVHFLMDAAPHDRLQAGAELVMFERGTRRWARVVVLE
jgi:hypothetical protein